ncbi:hypothetical protein Y032_0275g1029 [Ancylostoma ceylanicum]|uniref:Uncharacterized protein n=1 Tax=Ancylostoma ceylanicum TaxID=53326 RepID=A0A016S849_9BILA|nr:hypothetical protein Y032_0275g1029 [Ancylostoma ceylanicum]
MGEKTNHRLARPFARPAAETRAAAKRRARHRFLNGHFYDSSYMLLMIEYYVLRDGINQGRENMMAEGCLY